MTVASRRSGTEAKIQLPVADPQLAEFLKPTAEFTSTNKEVIDRAREIAGADKDAWSVARKLSKWIHKNLEWRFTAKADPSETLATREADCSEFSQLFVSMSRSLGLPARMVSGIAYGGSSFGGHAWVEVWAGRWIELDPTWGTDYVDATHIRGSSTSLISSAALHLIDIEVLEAKRTAAEFQQTSDSLARELSRALAEQDKPTIEAALDLETITDEFMGAGEFEKLSKEERSTMLSGFQRAELGLVFGLDQTGKEKYRFVHLDEKDGVAQAFLMAQGEKLIKLRLKARKGSWYLVDVEQTESGLHVVEDYLSPAIKTIRNKRAGSNLVVTQSEFSRAILLAHTKPDRAITVIDSALKTEQKNQRPRFVKALALLSAKKTEEALKLLTELSNEQPAYAPAVYNLARTLDFSESKEEKQKAIDYCRRYVSLEPDDPNGHKWLATAIEDTDVTQAEIEYRKALELDPDHWAAYYDLVYFFLEHDRLEGLGQVLSFADKHPEAGADMLGSIIEDLYFEESELAEKLALSQPQRMKTSFLGNLSLGRAYIDKSQPLKALPYLARAAQLDHETAEPHVAMANANRALQRWTIALRATDQALALDPKSSEAYYQRACILARIGRTGEAMKALSTALEISPTWAYSIAEENDLKSLSALPAFKKIIAGVEKEKAKDKDPE